MTPTMSITGMDATSHLSMKMVIAGMVILMSVIATGVDCVPVVAGLPISMLLTAGGGSDGGAAGAGVGAGAGWACGTGTNLPQDEHWTFFPDWSLSASSGWLQTGQLKFMSPLTRLLPWGQIPPGYAFLILTAVP